MNNHEKAAVEKHLADDRLPSLIEEFRQDLASLDDFTAESIERCLRDFADSKGVKAALIIHATRVLVTGMTVSPGLFEVLELLGKEKTLERLMRSNVYLTSGP